MEVNKNDKNSIDTIFRNQMQKHPDMKDEAMAMWEKHFEKEVRRRNFFVFGFWHFNIYIILGMLCALFLILFFINKPVETSSTSSSPLPAKPSSIINTKNDTDQTTEINSSETQVQTSTYTKPSSSLQKNSHASTIVASTRKDSLTGQTEFAPEPIPSSTQQTEITPTAPVVKKEKRIIYIEKRDTVETIDTIRSKKEWRQKNKTK